MPEGKVSSRGVGARPALEPEKGPVPADKWLRPAKKKAKFRI